MVHAHRAGFLPDWNLSVQRCRRLSEDGESLTPESLGRWRLPSTDEVVRSLVRHGGNAGCTWSGRLGERFQRAACRLLPDKETPLWAPNRSPIYYWTADERDARRAYFVSYNGGINHQPKQWGNPRHGYRCVKAP